MTRQFLRAKPLQACKLVAIAVVVPVGVAVFVGLLPTADVGMLFLLPLLALALVFVVTAETLVAGVRLVSAGGSLTDRFGERPVYAVVRAAEVLAVLLSVGVFASVLSLIPSGPMAGPGAIGLWMLMVALGVVVVAASLVRAVTEFYYYRAGVGA